MSQRFGGKYSPDGTKTSAPARRVDAAGARANVLFGPGIVLAVTAFGEGPVELMTDLAAAGILTLAAWLCREGLRAEAAYHARSIARRPGIPRKMMSSALTGVGIAMAAFTNDAGILNALLYGITTTALHVAAFGIDPLTNKRMEGVDTFQQDRVARVVDEAEAHLATIREQIASVGDRRLTARVSQFEAAALHMIDTVEKDPRDLTAARKYLGVYLMGAKDATVKFVDLYKRSKDATARADYEALLDDLQQNFAARTEKLMLDDRSDMDIEIKVLRDRLQREGVHLK